MVSPASQTERNDKPEEITYRKSLNIALDILNLKSNTTAATSSDEELTTPVSQKENQTEPLFSVSNCSPDFHKENLGRPGSFLNENEQFRPTSTKETGCEIDWKKPDKTHQNKTRLSTSPTTVVLGIQTPQGEDCQSSSSSRRKANLLQKATVDRRRTGGTRVDSPPDAMRGGEWCPTGESSPAWTATGCSKTTAAGKKADCSTKKYLDFSTNSASKWSENENITKSSRKYSKASDGSKNPVDQKQVLNTYMTRYQTRQHTRSTRSSPDTSDADWRSPDCSLTKIKNFQLPDFEDEEGFQSSDLSLELSSLETSSLNANFVDEEEEDEELPTILLHQKPCSIEAGMLVWCKCQKYPYWPAVVKSVRRKDKKASVLFVEKDVCPEKRGFTASLKRLKHFDCEEKQELMIKAKEEYSQDIDWCISLISDYRIRLGCGSFAGSFLEYCSADISYPVRKRIKQGAFTATFPGSKKDCPERPLLETPLSKVKPPKKVLPDRTRAARDRANEKLVEYIVKNKGAEDHLLAILKHKKQSRWLKEYLNSSQYMTCIETYLEDDEQLDLVVNYLQDVCQEIGSRLTLINGDKIKFILDVLLPEAIIYAISAVDEIDYKTAEEKYIKGPSLSKREREIFDKQLLDQKNLALSKIEPTSSKPAPDPSPDVSHPCHSVIESNIYNK
ncbi:PWWP domain-containing DNA repair factor 3A isoform X2 [Ornithorhynchus anatinus]|uniref:PWWP domain-containing DNA repair factor 3A isoform X2 n=1 Tax=Ornithorhynchus anatinus TaxID=9258 RepID=UPI0010A93D49|nr:PWWP domain-containing DNA repair factor 3A isoform X2 [Ornithorhynchus anatinus]XP_028906341.1 PWWP domain-containing DNA repair factor 3A isoform X2 [Ornithorhynchus anatinus]